MKDSVRKSTNFLAIVIIGLLFFIFGFVTWLNGILIPYLKIACELTDFQALFVAFAFYISYFVMAIPSSYILEKTGFKLGMMVGLFVMAIGTLLFVPAANYREYSLFLLGLFVMGTGLSILQTASNPYITILGPKESAAKRISILGICNKLAGTIAPLVLAYFILQDGDALIQRLAVLNPIDKAVELDLLAHRVIAPYIFMTVALVALGLGIYFSPLPKLEAQDSDEEYIKSGSKKSIMEYPQLILGAIALFLYVGAEVIAGDTIIRYGLALGIEINQAKVFTSYTLIAMIVGYILGIVLIPKIISQQKALLISGILGILFTVFAVFTSGFVSVFFVAILGLANALVWPAIWPLALDGLGKFIKIGSALLIMAIAGGALLPLLWGQLSDSFGAQQAYLVLIPCYLFIAYYASIGFKKRSW